MRDTCASILLYIFLQLIIVIMSMYGQIEHKLEPAVQLCSMWIRTYNKAHVGKSTEFNAYTVAKLITKLFETLHGDPT